MFCVSFFRFVSLCFFLSYLSYPVRWHCIRIQYDGIASHCLLCLLHNIVPGRLYYLCRSLVTTQQSSLSIGLTNLCYEYFIADRCVLHVDSFILPVEIQHNRLFLSVVPVVIQHEGIALYRLLCLLHKCGLKYLCRSLVTTQLSRIEKSARILEVLKSCAGERTRRTHNTHDVYQVARSKCTTSTAVYNVIM